MRRGTALLAACFLTLAAMAGCAGRHYEGTFRFDRAQVAGVSVTADFLRENGPSELQRLAGCSVIVEENMLTLVMPGPGHEAYSLAFVYKNGIIETSESDIDAAVRYSDEDGTLVFEFADGILVFSRED